MAEGDGVEVAPGGRSAILDEYAGQVTKRAAALDARAAVLDERERALEKTLKECVARKERVDDLENAFRKEMSVFLGDFSKRQQKLSVAEDKQNRCMKVLRTRVAMARDLLVDIKSVSDELRCKRRELDSVLRELAAAEVALTAAKHERQELDTDSQRRRKEESRLDEERTALQRLSTRLENAESRTREREDALRERERDVSEQAAKLNVMRPLQGLVAPLKSLVIDYQEAFSSDDRTRVRLPIQLVATTDNEQDYTSLGQSVLSIVQDLRSMARSCGVKQSEISERLRSAVEREKRVTQRERILLAREASVDEKEQCAAQAQAETGQRRVEIESAWASAEESRKENEERDSLLRSREAKLRDREVALMRKESSMQQTLHEVSAKDKSVRRAHNAVIERERATDDTAVQLEDMRRKLEVLERDIKLREEILATREIEISAREGSCALRLGSAQRGASGSQLDTESRANSGQNNQNDELGINVRADDVSMHDVEPMEKEQELVDDAVDAARLTATSGTSSSARGDGLGGRDRNGSLNASRVPAQPNSPTSLNVPRPADGTVRRHLAFEGTQRRTRPRAASATRRDTKVDEPPQGAPHVPHTERGSDAESETSYEQRLEELITARSVFVERVARLEAVLSSMSSDLRATGAQVGPVLLRVHSELERIRSEVAVSTDAQQNAATEPNVAVGVERNLHSKWAGILRRQLDTVRDVQAGLLIALNEEKESAQQRLATSPAIVRRGGDDARSSTSSSNSTEARASVVDGDRSDQDNFNAGRPVSAASDTVEVEDVLQDTVGDEGQVDVSFSQFRESLQQQLGGLLEPEPAIAGRASDYGDAIIAPILSDTFGSPGSPGRPSSLPGTSAVLRRDKVLIKLEALRRELDSVAGSNSKGYR